MALQKSELIDLKNHFNAETGTVLADVVYQVYTNVNNVVIPAGITEASVIAVASFSAGTDTTTWANNGEAVLAIAHDDGAAPTGLSTIDSTQSCVFSTVSNQSGLQIVVTTISYVTGLDPELSYQFGALVKKEGAVSPGTIVAKDCSLFVSGTLS